MNKKLLIVFIITAMLGLLIFFFKQFPRWTPLGTSLVLNGSFELVYKHWERFGSENTVFQDDSDGTRLLIKNNPGEFSGIYQEISLLPQNPLYLVSCDSGVQIEKRPGSKPWQAPSCVIIPKDDLGNLVWKEMRWFKNFNKNLRPGHFEKYLSFPENRKKAVIVIHIEDAQATLTLDNLELTPVKISPSRKQTEILLLGFSIAIFFWLCSMLPPVRGKWLLVMVASATALGMILPDFLLKEIFRAFHYSSCPTPVNSLSPNPWGLLNFPFIHSDDSLSLVKATSHFSLYLILSLFSVILYRSSPPFFILFNLVSFGVFTEVLQFFTLSRIPEFNGFRMNLFGILLGFTLGFIFLEYKKRNPLPPSFS